MEDFKSKKLTLVAFGAHPDPFDMPYQAGGTLAKYAKHGHQEEEMAAILLQKQGNAVTEVDKAVGFRIDPETRKWAGHLYTTR